MDLVCFERSLLSHLEPHTVGNNVSDSIEADVAVPVKWLLNQCFCCHSSDKLLRLDFVLLTLGLWPFIFILLYPS